MKYDPEILERAGRISDAELLRSASRHLNEQGWCDFAPFGDRRGVCLLQALALACGLDRTEWRRVVPPFALVQAIREQSPAMNVLGAPETVFIFNDRYCANQQAALAVLESAAALAESTDAFTVEVKDPEVAANDGAVMSTGAGPTGSDGCDFGETVTITFTDADGEAMAAWEAFNKGLRELTESLEVSSKVLLTFTSADASALIEESIDAISENQGRGPGLSTKVQGLLCVGQHGHRRDQTHHGCPAGDCRGARIQVEV